MQVVDLDGRRLATWDRGDGTPLLFISGVGTSGAFRQADLAELAADVPPAMHEARAHRPKGTCRTKVPTRVLPSVEASVASGPVVRTLAPARDFVVC
jgi:hypothetical protein